MKSAGLKAFFLQEQLLLAKISTSTRDVPASHGLQDHAKAAFPGGFSRLGGCPYSLLPSVLPDIGLEFKRHFFCPLRGLVFLWLQNITILVTVSKYSHRVKSGNCHGDKNSAHLKYLLIAIFQHSYRRGPWHTSADNCLTRFSNDLWVEGDLETTPPITPGGGNFLLCFSKTCYLREFGSFEPVSAGLLGVTAGSIRVSTAPTARPRVGGAGSAGTPRQR